MSNETLHVTTEHLRTLADRHEQASAELTAAGGLVGAVDTRLRTTHGVIAWSTAGAVATLQQSRQRAAERLAARSEALSDGLLWAAIRYRSADDNSGADVARQMPRWVPR
ncbi:type VII secretion target [Mycolicibacterium vaccae]|uniref:type VII secretion target n=1 Tax=Mycolicibacterium vaccae TaxID=1810 RepID=UPI003D06C46B